MSEAEYIEVEGTGSRRMIAVRRIRGSNPGLVWLGGYRSDMSGTKALALEEWARGKGLACCRHDYSGHGESGGEFQDGTISRWLEESLAVFDSFTEGPQILIGSSMGAWIGLRMAQELEKRGEGKRLHAMLLIAPAPDFTQELMWPELTPAQRQALEEDGYIEEPSEYSDEPNIYTRALFEDGEANRVMKGHVETGCPVHILQGMKDPDVPHTHAMKVAECLAGDQVTVTLIKDGDHRLSRPEDIALMLRCVRALAEG